MTIMNSWHFQGEELISSPQLIIDRDRLIRNINKAISLARGAEYLWPHVKTHKTGQIVRLMAQRGITRFKCATIAEAEMAASFGGKHIALAYPLVGPSIQRFLNLQTAFPDVTFYAVGDSSEGLSALDRAAKSCGQTVPLLIDVNMGMNRTGVPICGLEALYRQAAECSNLLPLGLHCYDGHRSESRYSERKQAVERDLSRILETKQDLENSGLRCDILIMGGTPTFPCYAEARGCHLYYSPGTLFLNDGGYRAKYPDLDFPIAAAILSRVVSLPGPGIFTIDLGYKGIASDPEGVRGILVDCHAHPVFQSEEHWVFEMDPGHEAERPKLGQILYVIPTHICPTSALYPYILAVEHEKVRAKWEVTARNRQITC